MDPTTCTSSAEHPNGKRPDHMEVITCVRAAVARTNNLSIFDHAKVVVQEKKTAIESHKNMLQTPIILEEMAKAEATVADVQDTLPNETAGASFAGVRSVGLAQCPAVLGVAG